MKRVLLITTLGLLIASSAMADMNNCRFALHYKANTTKATTICTTYSPNATNLPCTSYTVTGPAPSSGLVYIVVGRGGPEGINGVSFGIDYSGRGSVGISPTFTTFTRCADGLDFPNSGGLGDFPAPLGGTRVTWLTCQTQTIAPAGVHAVIGTLYIYAYSGDQLKITPNNNLASGIPELAVNSCAATTTDLYLLWGPTIVTQVEGIVGVGGQSGYNPCLVTPAQTTTWGKIKSQYSNN